MIITPEIERETPRDVASDFALRETPLGEYLGAKTARGFDFTTTRLAYDAVRIGMAERNAYGLGDDRPEYNLHRPELWGPDGYDPLRPYRMDEETWKRSEYYREGIAYTPKMTRVRARIMAEDFDKRRYRDSLIERSPSGARSILGFGAELLGNLPDPVNLLPLGLAGKGGSTLARMGYAAAEGAAGAGLADALILPDLAERGEDVGWQDAANDILFGALIGGLAGGIGKKLEDRRAAVREARLKTVMEDRATAGRAMEKALDDFSADRPVDVRPVLDTPEGQRLADEVAGLGRLYNEALFDPLNIAGNGEVVLRSIVDEALAPAWGEIVVDKGAGRIDGKRITRELNYGLVKIIYDHGELSPKKAGKQVTRQDMLDFPRVVRDYAPSAVKMERGTQTRVWVVPGGRGGQVIHVAKLFSDQDGRPHLVTSHTANQSTPYAPSRLYTDKEKAALLASRGTSLPGPADTGLGPSTRTTQGASMAAEGNIEQAKRGVNWATEQADQVERAPALVDDETLGLDPKTLDDPEARAVAELESKGELLAEEADALRSAQDAFDRSAKFEEAGLSIVECILQEAE